MRARYPGVLAGSFLLLPLLPFQTLVSQAQSGGPNMPVRVSSSWPGIIFYKGEAPVPSA